MADFLATLSSHYGVVAITDLQKNPLSTATFSINNECIVVVFRGANSVKQFLDSYVLPSKTLNFEKLIQKTIDEFNKHNSEFVQDNFSFLIASFVDHTAEYHAFWFADNKAFYAKQEKKVHFIQNIEDVGDYLVSKVYSSHMSLEEIKNLTAYIALQSIKSLGYEFDFDITLLSEKGVEKLSDGEIKELFHKMDMVDHKFKKIFSDFFINVENKQI